MKKLLVLPFIFLAACQGANDMTSATSAPADKSNQSLTTIVGGSDVDAASPVARIVLSHRTLIDDSMGEGDFFDEGVRIAQCSAAALTRNLVLTAAHCVHENSLGTIEFVDADGTEMSIQVKSATIIENYQTDKTADLAILSLKADLPGFVQAITLPDANTAIDLQKTGIIAAGYGYNVDVKPFKGTGVLRSVKAKVEKYSIDSNYFIVDQTDGTGICQGDSGGPGLVEFDGKMYAIGVAAKTMFMPVESGESQHTCNFKSVYVNLLKFKPWIEKTVLALQRGN